MLTMLYSIGMIDTGQDRPNSAKYLEMNYAS